MSIAELIAALRAAKAAETAAKTDRLKIEGLIEAQFAKPANGEGTHNDEEFKISWKLTRAVDTAAVQTAWDAISKNAQRHSAGRQRLISPTSAPCKTLTQPPMRKLPSTSPPNPQNHPLN